MNLEKGFKRLTIVLSFLAGPLVILYRFATEGIPMDALLRYEFLIVLFVYEVIGFVAVWIIYWSICWTVEGFRDEKPKGERNNK